MSEIVIRQLTPEITTFSKPFSKFLGLLPMGGRSTAIKLSDDTLWVIASTPLTRGTKDAIDDMNATVVYIVAASADHHFYLTEWHKAYPEAKVIGVQGLPEKKKGEDWQFTGSYGVDPADATYGFEDEIKAIYFSGFSKKDVAWFHVASKTLLVADLIFNLPATEQYSKSDSPNAKPAFFFPKFEPYSDGFKKFLWAEGKDKSEMKRDAKAVAEWDFERIIMCHGDVIEKDAKKAWESAFSRYLV
ncbi:hypothetical protein EUX98_g3624 [Antrodiella citrinella]|uniref:Metallo-beta-lactamase domain-containing protein n=1 Tax=Antrodiella citrinella TaxID=2447956 RepID=A0A4V3XIU5_9APHY|nr:hypothetical protein EUX98_g3624 [Antrodiella citrinella]